MFYGLLIISLLYVSCATIKLEHYEPKSADEEEIVKVLLTNLETNRNRDISGHLSTFHDDASIQVWISGEDRPIVSKVDYGELKPETHYWGIPGRLSITSINIRGNDAIVKCRHHVERWKTSVTFLLVKENDQWLIMEYTFGVYL